MSILKTKHRSLVEGKFVGVILSHELHSYLTLHSLAKGITKSDIIRKQLEEWWEDWGYDRNETEDILLSMISQRAQNEWESSLRSRQPSLTLIKFKQELTKDLKGKGLTEDQIHIIISSLK